MIDNEYTDNNIHALSLRVRSQELRKCSESHAACCRLTRADTTSRALAPLGACPDAPRGTDGSVQMVCDKTRATCASVRLICDEELPLRQEDTHHWVSCTACHHAEQSVATPEACVRVACRTPMLASMPPILPRRRWFELCQDAAYLSTRRQCALRGELQKFRAGCSLQCGRIFNFHTGISKLHPLLQCACNF